MRVVAIDPGHANLVTATIGTLRSFLCASGAASSPKTEPLRGAPATPGPLGPTNTKPMRAPNATSVPWLSRRQKRRRAKRAYLERCQQSTFVKSNRQWRHETGSTFMHRSELKLRSTLRLQPAIDRLATASARTADAGRYRAHIAARLATAGVFATRMAVRCQRRWALAVHSREQRAVQKLSADLLGAGVPSRTLVVWGDGGFAPTSKGHAAAPNLKLQRQLARFLPVVTSTEFGTSKHSCCCAALTTSLRAASYRRRATVLRCTACRTLLGRDTSASSLIGQLFALGHVSQAPVSLRPGHDLEKRRFACREVGSGGQQGEEKPRRWLKQEKQQTEKGEWQGGKGF